MDNDNQLNYLKNNNPFMKGRQMNMDGFNSNNNNMNNNKYFGSYQDQNYNYQLNVSNVSSNNNGLSRVKSQKYINLDLLSPSPITNTNNQNYNHHYYSSKLITNNIQNKDYPTKDYNYQYKNYTSDYNNYSSLPLQNPFYSKKNLLQRINNHNQYGTNNSHNTTIINNLNFNLNTSYTHLSSTSNHNINHYYNNQQPYSRMIQQFDKDAIRRDQLYSKQMAILENYGPQALRYHGYDKEKFDSISSANNLQNLHKDYNTGHKYSYAYNPQRDKEVNNNQDTYNKSNKNNNYENYHNNKYDPIGNNYYPYSNSIKDIPSNSNIVYQQNEQSYSKPSLNNFQDRKNQKSRQKLKSQKSITSIPSSKKFRQDIKYQTYNNTKNQSGIIKFDEDQEEDQTDQNNKNSKNTNKNKKQQFINSQTQIYNGIINMKEKGFYQNQDSKYSIENNQNTSKKRKQYNDGKNMPFQSSGVQQDDYKNLMKKNSLSNSKGNNGRFINDQIKQNRQDDEDVPFFKNSTINQTKHQYPTQNNINNRGGAVSRSLKQNDIPQLLEIKGKLYYFIQNKNEQQ